MHRTWFIGIYVLSLLHPIYAQCPNWANRDDFFLLPGSNQVDQKTPPENLPTYNVGETIQFTWYTSLDSVSLALATTNYSAHLLAPNIYESSWNWVNAQPAAIQLMEGSTIFFMLMTKANDTNTYLTCSSWFKIIDPASSSTTATSSITPPTSTGTPINQTSVASVPTSTPRNNNPDGSKKSVAIGAGTGVAVGILALGALGYGIFYMKRRKNRRRGEVPMSTQYEPALEVKDELHDRSSTLLSSPYIANSASGRNSRQEGITSSDNRHSGPPVELSGRHN